MWEDQDLHTQDPDQMWSVDAQGFSEPWNEESFQEELDMPQTGLVATKKMSIVAETVPDVVKAPKEERTPARLSEDMMQRLQNNSTPTVEPVRPTPGRLSVPKFAPEPEEAKTASVPVRKVSSAFQERDQGDQPINRPVRKISRLLAEQERARQEEQDKLNREKDEKFRIEEGKRKIREEELRQGKLEVKMTRRRREDALRTAQRKYEEELNKKYDNLSEADLLERQKRLLAQQILIREQETALRQQEEEEFTKPTEKDFQEAEENSTTHTALKFIINPEWGIPSLQQSDGRPRHLIQMRKLQHLSEAPRNLDIRYECVLVVFSDVSFICTIDRERAGGLRLLFPPCNNDKVFTGPSFALEYTALFSLRFDKLGPFYFECSGDSEVRYWNKMYAKAA